MVGKRNQVFVRSRLERALTALDADYILNDEGGTYFHQLLTGEE